MLEKLPSNNSIFIDSNIFIYHFLGISEPCTNFFKILTVTVEAIFQSRALRKEFGLMTNDSLNLQVMKINDLNDIATNDSDFSRVEWLKVWNPEPI
ncbi:MAG: PIN domain-containing protein [Candidatus Methanoperedens sp.]|nr:PIN domain-containing protein [Candidatus Methanoperedens sp.]